MSEGQGFAERVLHGIKGKYYGAIGLQPGSNPEWHRNVESEKRAKQTVEQYRRISSQEPSATFLADSASVFDLTQYETGTIVRIEYLLPLSAEPDLPRYRWFVFGDRKGNSVLIYDISFTGEDKHPPQLPRDGWLQIFAEEPIKLHSFPVKDSMFVFSDQEKFYADNEERKSALERLHNVHPITKVDIMSMGKTSKAREKNSQTKIKTQRQLAPETV